MINNPRLLSIHPKPLGITQATSNAKVRDNAFELANSPNVDSVLLKQSPEAFSTAMNSPEDIFNGKSRLRKRLFSFSERTRASSMMSGNKRFFQLKSYRPPIITRKGSIARYCRSST